MPSRGAKWLSSFPPLRALRIFAVRVVHARFSGKGAIFQFAGAALEETMVRPLIPSGVVAAIAAGAAMAVVLSSCPSFAFTLSAPSLAQSIVKADVQQVYYYGHHYYHPYYHHTYYHPYHYDHYNNSYRVRHYQPRPNYHNYY
jgi:hypothetical protein